MLFFFSLYLSIHSDWSRINSLRSPQQSLESEERGVTEEVLQKFNFWLIWAWNRNQRMCFLHLLEVTFQNFGVLFCVFWILVFSLWYLFFSIRTKLVIHSHKSFICSAMYCGTFSSTSFNPLAALNILILLFVKFL